MDNREFKLQTQVGEVACKVWNEQGSDSILALHGWLDNLASFEPLASALNTRRIYACDLPGHGHSFHLSEGAVYHMVDAAYDLHAIVTALGFNKVDLIGHSMGTGVSLLLAAVAPDLVRSIVMIDGIGPLSAPSEAVVDALQTNFRQRRRLGMKRLPVYKTAEEGLIARMGAADISQDAARPIVHRGLKEVPEGLTWRSDPRLRFKSSHPFTEEQVLAFARAVMCPVLFVHSREGFPFGDHILEGRMRAIAKLEYRVVNGKHHVHMDSAQELAELIEDFYGRHRQTERT